MVREERGEVGLFNNHCKKSIYTVCEMIMNRKKEHPGKDANIKNNKKIRAN